MTSFTWDGGEFCRYFESRKMSFIIDLMFRRDVVPKRCVRGE